MEKDIREEIFAALKDGNSKQEIFDKYKESEDNNVLRRFLASRPSKEVKNKFKSLNRVIIVLWLAILLIELLGILIEIDLLSVASILVTIFILFKLDVFDGNIYMSSILWAGWGIFWILRELTSLSTSLAPEEEEDIPLLLVTIAFFVLIKMIIIVCSLLIKRKAFPYYSWFQPKKDDQGNFQFE
ncbi:MAG: hypothetical protein ABFS05_08040 [Bacteroidota bacterium]